MKNDAYIEIVASSKGRLNAMSAESQATVLAALHKRYSKVAVTIVDTVDDLEQLVAKQPDLVILGMKLVLTDALASYEDSPKVWLTDYLNENDIAFTGSETEALKFEFDKPTAKQRVINAGLESSRYFVSEIKQPIFEHDLTFPLFVKPTNRGDSKGIDEKSLVYTQDALVEKITSIHENCQSNALVEEYLPGREFSVVIIDHPYGFEQLVMPIEIIAPPDSNGNRFLSEAIKEADSERVAPVTDVALREALCALAAGVFKALGARDYGRIDLRLDANDVPSFVEANLMPGLSNHGYLRRCALLNADISYEDMILSIVDPAMNRQSSQYRFVPAHASAD